MPRRFSVFLSLLTLAACVLQAQAQKYTAKSIQFKGDDEYSQAEMLAATGLKRGASLTPAEMDEHSKEPALGRILNGVSYVWHLSVDPQTHMVDVVISLAKRN
jgi:hypothetical protein